MHQVWIVGLKDSSWSVEIFVSCGDKDGKEVFTVRLPCAKQPEAFKSSKADFLDQRIIRGLDALYKAVEDSIAREKEGKFLTYDKASKKIDRLFALVKVDGRNDWPVATEYALDGWDKEFAL